ncbi:MAG: hypothetical protein P4M15_10920 [Alphaproteobacteria bacterium]|nr:hypothetical protein [Alphaproteobacteria bacterium]
MMKYFFLVVIALLAAAPAFAGQPEAREVARINNCPPKKIDVYQNSPGPMGVTIYQVTCNLPKTTDKNAPAGPDALLISCDAALCEMLRPITLSKQ